MDQTSSSLILSLMSLSLVTCTSDLNILKLQMVADHLTELECHKLFEALHMRQFFLEHTPSGTELPETDCLDLLLSWDRETGSKKTFHLLALRLREIFRHDVAEKLSRAVLHERAEAVDVDFKNLANPHNPLMINGHHLDVREEEVEQNNHVAQPEDDSISGHFITFFSVIGGISGLIIFTFLFDKFVYPVTEICGFCKDVVSSRIIGTEKIQYTKVKSKRSIARPGADILETAQERNSIISM